MFSSLFFYFGTLFVFVLTCAGSINLFLIFAGFSQLIIIGHDMVSLWPLIRDLNC
jgi:hypothetical protein